MEAERETQFLAALLLLGPVPKLKQCLEFASRERDRERYQSYGLYKKHKIKLLAHLAEADYFDVYYEVPGTRYDPNTHMQLTEKAALWIGEFYQWMLKEQQRGR